MTSIASVGALVLKLLKLVLNFIILILYRTGFQGEFLGVGGTWNLNEEKNPDAEIVASGIFVGYFIYTSVSVISLCFGTRDNKTSFTDICMNIIGVFMWVAVGATALHYWHGYLAEHKYMAISSERQVGLAMGALSIINAALYLVDSVCAIFFVVQERLKD